MNTGQVILSYVLASMSVFCFATGMFLPQAAVVVVAQG